MDTRQGEPATVDEFDANGILRRVFPDGSEMVLTDYGSLVQAWRVAAPTELLQEGKSRYVKP